MHRFILTAVLLIAAFFRFSSLDTHMPALYGDEISIAYNAYSILKTGKDEFGAFMPIQFVSWGDMKNPVYIYLTSIFQIPFGLSEWSVRLPSALAGVAAVYLTYLITRRLLTHTQSTSVIPTATGLVASTLVAINPWHIHISRGGYEANVALTLGLLAVYMLLKYFDSTSKKHLFLTLIPAIAAMYTYYTTKMFLPILLVLVFVWGYFSLQKNKSYLKDSILFFALFVLACLPIAYLALFSQGQARFQTINIFANPTVENRVVTNRNIYGADNVLIKLLENKYTYYLRDFLEHYFDNFSGQFWYTAGDSSLRYSMRDHGMFYLIELPFLITGFFLLYKHNRKAWLLLVVWILLAPLPTALVGRAYGLRSLSMLPIPMIFTAYGITNSVAYLKSRHDRVAVSTVLGAVFLVSVINWTARYAYLYPVYGQYWYDSMQKEAISYAQSQEKNYDSIVITRYYGKTEMYYAFYDKLDPHIYQTNSQKEVKFLNSPMIQFGKYYFGDIQEYTKGFDALDIPTRTLVIAAPDFPYADETISAKDDSRPLFKIIKK